MSKSQLIFQVFQCMLLNNAWQECKESVIHLVEEEKCCRVFPQFLKYLYTGQVRISIETAMPLLSLADKYNIKDLIALCVTFMTKSIALAGQSGFLINWLQYTLSFNYHQQLTNELKNFLRLNIEIVGYSRDFVDIDPNNLVVLLQQNDLVIKNEAALFDIVERWLMIKREQIEHEESLSDEDKGLHMKSLIEGICTHIRFPMMTVSELASIPLKPITAFSKEFFCDRMALGMSFHAAQQYRNEGDISELNLQYTPRLYTSDVFCLEMKVEEVHNVENYKNFGACFFSLSEFPYNSNDSSDGEIFEKNI
jgi:BTB/POZ domain-containing protein 17